MDEVTLITYSEIGLKSAPVRRTLEHQLKRHIMNSLKRGGITDARIRRIRGRLIVECADPYVAAEIASKVFGVASTFPAIKITSEMDAIIGAILDLALPIIKDNHTFAIRARRVGEQRFTSKDIEVKAGGEVLRRLKSRGVKVNLDNPDVTIHVEVRNGDSYVYHKVIAGPRGLPFSSQGRLISLFSGGIDSPVASWLMMKRGANVKLLFLDQRPFVGEDYYMRALDVSKKLRQYVPHRSYALYVAPMREIMEEIIKQVPAKFTCIICKRIMYQIACALAEQMNAGGIVTGENLGQVASQTLTNLKVLDQRADLPVYRPLIGFEKMEIVALAKKIGTYEASIASIHGCSAVPTKPTTKARMEYILKVETRLPISRLISNALEKLKKIPI